ncbi:MAG TPA: hypothetical protein VF476_17095, partial [Chitinophagaceae bacterium]
MIRTLILAAMIMSLPFAADAQLGSLLKKVKDKSTQRADQRVDKEIDKALDKAEGKNTSPAPGSTQTEKKETATETVVAEENNIRSFSKFDFIPGDSILYYDAFEGESIAELPTAWNTNGSGEVVKLDKYPGNWLRLHKQFIYLTSNQKKFTENFTLEFDAILDLKNNGWMFPELRVGLFNTEDEATTANAFLKDYRKNAAVIATIYPGTGANSKVRINSYQDVKSYFTSEAKAYEQLEKT